MLKKIISGGQTGADLAALDFAIKFNIPHGGWIPKGRKTEAGCLPLQYRLKEMETFDYKSRTKQNLRDSQGTAIISRGRLTSGSWLTQSFAKVLGKPNCHINLATRDSFEASIILQSFILENQIEVLNVAGPRASHDPGIYFDVKSILESVLYLIFLDSGQEDQIKALVPTDPITEDFPKTKDEAVELIEGELPLTTKTYIARLDDASASIQALYFGWLDYIRRRVGLDSGNQVLLTQLRQGMDAKVFTIEDGIMEILKSLHYSLQTRYSLKVVK
jgi:hypothetical protein